MNFSEMDVSIQIAVLAAGSAIFGSVIGLLGAFIGGMVAGSYQLRQEQMRLRAATIQSELATLRDAAAKIVQSRAGTMRYAAQRHDQQSFLSELDSLRRALEFFILYPSTDISLRSLEFIDVLASWQHSIGSEHYDLQCQRVADVHEELRFIVRAEVRRLVNKVAANEFVD